MNKEPPLPDNSRQEGSVAVAFPKDSKDPTADTIHHRDGHHHSNNNMTEIINRENNEHSRITTNQEEQQRREYSCNGEHHQNTKFNGDENSNIHHLRYSQEDTPNRIIASTTNPRREELPPLNVNDTTTNNNHQSTLYNLPPIITRINNNKNNNGHSMRELVIEEGDEATQVTNKIVTQESFRDETNIPQELDNNLIESNDDEEPTNGEPSMIVWCDMCNKEVKSWRHHEKTRLHQSNLWNNNRKKRPSPPRFKFINVVKQSSSPMTSSNNIENGSTSINSTITPQQTSPIKPISNTSTPLNTSSTPTSSNNISNANLSVLQSGSANMIVSQSSSSSSSNLSSNYALGNNNGYYSSKSDSLQNSSENIDEVRAPNSHKRKLTDFQNIMKKSESFSRNTPSSSTSDSSTDTKVNNNGRGHNRVHSPPSRPSMNYTMNIQLTDSKTRHLFLSSTPEEQQQMFTNSEKGYAFMEQLKRFRSSNENPYEQAQQGVTINQSYPQHTTQHHSNNNNNNQSHHTGSTDNLQQSVNRQMNNYSSNQYHAYQIEDRRSTPATTLPNSQHNSQPTPNYHHVNNRNHSILLSEPKNSTTDWIDMTNSNNQKKQKKETKSQLQFVDHFEQKTKKRK